MSEKLDDVKKIFQDYINKYNGKLYVYDSLLVIHHEPYLIVYEDDKREGTMSNSTKINGSIIVSMLHDLNGEFMVEKKRGFLIRNISSFVTNLKAIKEIEDYTVYYKNEELKCILKNVFQDVQYKQYLDSIELDMIRLKEKTLQVCYSVHNNNAQYIHLDDLEKWIEELNQTYRVLDFYQKR
ncbi:MAG: hypothetical protein ACI4SR_01465 [Faecalibacillus sp.]